MRVLTLGFAGIVVVSTALGLLWATEVLPSADLAKVAGYTYGGMFVLLLGGLGLRSVARGGEPQDESDRRVP